jgi:DNA-binding response OmpR family regulator
MLSARPAEMSSSAPSGGRILLVEDDEGLRSAVALVLRASGYDVEESGYGLDALARFDPGLDVVVLDVMLPGADGFEVCRRIREQSKVPVVMITARDGAGDVVQGLELGADDYITKPFESAVLLARIRAVLRRAGNDEPSTVLECGELRVDEAAHRAWCGDAELDLTATEFRLLAELVRHAGQAMTRQLLLELVWGYDYLGDSRLVDMAVKRLRDKIEDDATSPTKIATLRGVGYRCECA